MKFPSGGGMGQLLGQAQKMQEQMKVMQEKLSKEEFNLESAGGKIKVTVNGKNEVLKLEISKELVASGDAELVADMVKIAVNQALGEAQKKMSDEMAKLVPPGLAGLF
jgi:DNA-binding YbaB/EbfC family protein